ncbi:MAG: hypothetical protein GX908_03615, partial [Gammaproteobacteria bacterium]|nr:hypothetical protein [Gammaproteobacteria bacterium]
MQILTVLAMMVFAGAAVVVYALYVGKQSRLMHNWGTYTVLFIVLSQGGLLALFALGFSTVRPLDFIGFMWLAGVWLSCTVTREIVLGRQREKVALADIEQL